jgi:hypothetical protein
VNNAGEFHVDSTSVRHRFWIPGKSTFAPGEYIDWQQGSWPSPRVWPEAK